MIKLHACRCAHLLFHGDLGRFGVFATFLGTQPARLLTLTFVP